MIGWRHLLPHPLATNYKNLRSWMRGCKLRTPSFSVRRRSLSFSIRSRSLMPTSRHGAHMSTSPYPNPSTPSRPHFLFFFPSTPWRPHCLVIHSPQFLLVRAQNSHQPATTRPHPHPLPSAQLQNWEDQPEYFKMIARRQNKLWKPIPFLVFVILPTVHVNLNSSSCCFYIFSCHTSH